MPEELDHGIGIIESLWKSRLIKVMHVDSPGCAYKR
jgi:hypothetical protein